MAICHHFAPNGEKSALYQNLETKYGEKLAHDAWTAIRTQQFLNKENWLKGKVSSEYLDNNGEPRIDWVEQQLNLKAPTPRFKPANKEQSDAITGIQNFITSGDAKDYFTVEGKAGTGKTTIVQEALAPFIDQGKRVLVTALSHKAKLVLANKLEDRFGSGAVNSKSIAGALAMSFDMETGEFSADYDNDRTVPPIAMADIVVVDEASMVNEEALQLIMERKKRGAKVIFLGDIGQLPPIRKQGDPHAGKPAPVFGTTDNKTRLLERVRQGEESPILPYADLFWNNSQSDRAKENPAPAEMRKDVVNDKGALVFASSVGDVLPEVLPLYKEAIETNQPNLIKTVLYRNAPRISVNNAVREFVFGNDAKTQFLPKELLIFTDNYTPEGWKEPISNATEIQLSSATPRITSDADKFRVWDVEFGYEGSPVLISAMDTRDVARHTAKVSALFNEAKKMSKGPERNRKLKEAWAEKKKYAPLDYSYAITSHKSQGSTYNTVVVVENDIMSVGPITAKEKSQSIYTALTRASTSTIVVDGQKTNHDNLGKAITLAQSKPTQPVVQPVAPVAPPVVVKPPVQEVVPPKEPVKVVPPVVPTQPVTGTKSPVSSGTTNSTTPLQQVIAENPITAPHLINRDEERIKLDRAKIDIRKMDADGKTVGFFSPDEHRAIVDSTVYLTQKLLLRDPLLKGNALIKIMTSYGDAATKLPDGDRKSNFEFIDRERVRLAEDAIRRLGLLGWNISDKTTKAILRGVQNYTQLGEQDKQLDAQDGTIAVLQQDETAEEIKEEAGHGLIDYSDSSFELDPKDTASARMKMFIANQPEVDLEGQPIKNFLGLAKLVDFEAIFEDTLNELADHRTGKFEDMVADLKATGKPNLVYLAGELEKQDDQMKNEFVKVMSKQYQQFSMMLFNRIKDNKTGNESFSLNVVNANRYSQTATIINNWKEVQKLSPIMKVDEAGHRVIDTERAKTWVPQIKLGVNIDWTKTENVDKYKKFIQNILSVSGVEMSDKAMDYLFKNMEKITKGTSVAGGLAKQFKISKDGKPEGMFSAFAMKMAGMVSEQDATIPTKVAQERAFQNNPLNTENTTMNILAKVAARFTTKLYSATHKSSEGKNVWDYGQHTKLSHRLQLMVRDFSTFSATLGGTNIAKDNWLLSALKNDPAKLANIKLTYLDGLKATWQKKGTTRQGMSDREQILTSIALFQNQGRATSHFISLTHSDKTTTPVMTNMPRLAAVNPTHVGLSVTGQAIPNAYIGGIGSPLYNVFKSEWSRITASEKTDFNNKQYNAGKGLFYFFPEFNYDAMAKMVKSGTITQAEMNKLWVDGKRSLTRNINNDAELKVINKILTIVTNRRVDKLMKQWHDQGIMKWDKEGKSTIMFDKAYLEKVIRPLEAGPKDYARAVALHYSVNYFLHNTSMSQLFYGDPALAYKGKEGQNDVQKVAATMKEYAKRLAKDIAPGQDGAWKEGEKSYQAITLADVKTSESYLPEALRKAYGEVEGTDAQEITTVEEHLKVGYAYGLIPTKTFNEMMDIIRKAGPGGHYEFTVPEHKAVIMQPMKPVVAGPSSLINGTILEDYVKSSSYPLYPPMVQGTEMDKLRQWMEKKGTSRAAFASAVKMGAPTGTLSVFDKEGNFIEPTEQSWKGATKTLSRDNFRIQQEVPYDEEKEAIKIVSQMNKLITEGISEIQGFVLPGHEGTLSGEQLRAVKEDIRKQMVRMNAEHFMEQMGAIQRDGQMTLSDKKKVYDMLAEEARKKGYTLNELQGLLTRDKDGNLAIPLMLNTAADRFESLLMSMVKKIAETKMPGKSYVQASSVGLKFTKEGAIDKSKVVWMGDYDGTALRTAHMGADGKVKPAQVLAPFNFYGADGKKLKIEDFTEISNDGKRVINITALPKELTQLVGARIPNQGHNSMLPIEIVGFIPDNMGDLIVVPAAITKQMGADFDVDKLYTYKRPYTVKDGTIAEQARDSSKEGLQAQYFDTHWSVLNHPEMLEKVLRPLDKNDLKDENELLAPKEDSVDYYDVTNQLQDFQSGKDAKTLVGSTSLSVTFNSVIQNKALYYGRTEFTDDGPVTVRDYVTVLADDGKTKIKLTNLSGNGTSTYKGEKRTKHDNLTTMQSAAVDNAKDRTLDNLNLTTNTYRAAAAFIQLEDGDGTAIDLRYVTRLLTQPIIREYDALMKSGNDSLSDAFDKDLQTAVYGRLIDKYKGENMSELDTDNLAFNPDLLLKAQSMTGDDFMVHQRAALQLFKKLDKVGERLVQLQSLANGDTNGAGQRLIGSLDKASKMASIEQDPVYGAEGIFARTEQGTIFDNTIGMANSIVTKLLPYDKLVPVFEGIRKLANKDRLSEDQRLGIIKGIRSFIYTEGQHWWKNPQADRVRLLYNHKDNKSLAQRLLAAKDSWGKDNYFLQRLSAEIGATVEAPDYVSYQAASVGTIDEEQNHRSWIDLLMSEDATKRQLGEDLLRYAYLTGGVQDANSFVKFVPVSYIANTPFGEMLKAREKGFMEYKDGDENTDAITLQGFTRQFIQHNPEIATQVSQAAFGATIKEGQDYPESFEVPDLDAENAPTQLKGTPPYISYYSKGEGKYVLYQLQKVGEGLYYSRIDTLGNQFTDEYSGSAESIRSIFPENRSLAVAIPVADATQQIEDFKKPGGVLEETGIVLGGEGAINQSARNIANNPKVSGHLRAAAKVLSNINIVLPEMQRFGEQSAAMELLDKKGTMGNASTTGKIRINPSNHSTINEVADTFVHELAHHKLQLIAMLAGFDDRNSDKITKYIEEFQKKYPEVTRRLYAIDRIRYDALEAAKKKYGQAFVEQVLYDIKNNSDKALPGDSGSVIYALSNLQEFLAGVMTNHDLMKLLNDTDSKRSTSFLAQIWDLISDIFLELTSAYKTPVRDQSLLKEALVHTLALTKPATYGTINDGLSNNKMVVATEAKAGELKSLGEETYGRRTTITETPLHYEVQITSNKVQSHSVTGQAGKILDKLYQQLDDMGYAMNNKSTKAEKIEARGRYIQLKEDIAVLSRERNLDYIAEIGRRQLGWIDKILNTDHPTDSDVLTAIKTADTWSGLTELMYGDLTVEVQNNPEFASLQDEAMRKRIALMNSKARGVVVEALNGRMDLTGMDYKENLKDLDYGTANFLTLSRTKPKLLQGIAVLGRQAANNRDEEIARVAKRLQTLEAKMKSNGIRAEQLIQDKNWGLVQRLSGEWYHHIGELQGKRDMALDGLEKNEKDAAKRKTGKSEVWNRYWNEIKKTATFVDATVFYDFKSGQKAVGEKVEKARAKLVQEVGSEQYADELIEKGHQKFLQYLEEREIAKQHIATMGLTPEEEAAEYEKWKMYNSPNDFLSKMKKSGEVKYLNNGDRWVVMVPKASNKQFYDQKFTDIQQGPKALQEVYQEYKDIISEMTGYIPEGEANKLNEDFLPIVSPETIRSLSNMIGSIRNWDKAVLRSLTATDYEEMARLKEDRIPVMYTRATKSTEDIASRSTDLIRVAEVFSMMALHHKHMAPVADAISVAEAIVKEENRQRVNNNEKGLRNAMDAVKYFKDKLIYKKPTELEGKIDNPIYSLNPVTQYKIQAKVKALMEEKEKINKSAESNDELNFSDDDPGAKRLEEINKELDKYERDARHIYGSKVADTLIGINQMKALSYNPFSAVSNFTFGLVSVSIHANSRIDFDNKSMRWAMGKMMHSTSKYFTFGAHNNGDAQKIHNLMDRTGIMGEVVDTDYGHSNLKTRKSKSIVEAVKPFNWQKSGDYYAKGVMMVAMLKHKMVDVTSSDGTTKKVSLWDALDNEGKWNEKEYGSAPNWYSADVSEQKDWNNFRDKIRKVGIIVFGNQDKNAPLMAKKQWLFRLAGQFRMSWFSEGLATRFMGEREDAELGRTVKGRWTTYRDLGYVNSALLIAKLAMSSIPGLKVNPFDGTTNKKGEAISDVDIENMRKNFSGLAWTVAFTAAILMIRGLAMDDDKQGKRKSAAKKKLQLVLNMLIRNHQDLMLYSSPAVFDTVTGNFLPATTVITDTIKALKASGHYMVNPDEKDAFDKWFRKQCRALPIANLYPKTSYMLGRDLDAISK